MLSGLRSVPDPPPSSSVSPPAMALSLRPTLVGVYLCILSALASALPAPQEAVLAPGGRERSAVQRIVDEIAASRRQIDQRLFKRLTGIGTRESFDAMTKVCKSLQGPSVLKPAYAAFENYVGVEGLEKRSVAWLAEEASGSREPARRAAARGLARFGTGAQRELKHLLLRSKDEQVRAFALGPLLTGLSDEGTPGSLESILKNAVVGPSGNRESIVEALGGFDSGACATVFLASLRDKQVSPAIKMIVIETIGGRELPGLVKALVGALKDRSADVQIAAMDALDQCEGTSHAAALRKLAKSKNEAVRRRAVISLGRLRAGDGGWLEELQKLADEKDPALRMGAAVALAELRTPEALDALHMLLGDSDHLVRREALQQIGNLRRKQSIPALIGRVNGAGGRFKLDLLTTLRLFTGLDNGTSFERWKRWWDNEHEGFELPDYEDALRTERSRERREGEGRTASSFYGLKIVSDRICFIMDISGSMEEQSGRQSRIEVARGELRGVLESYPEGDLFNVIFFSSDAFPWQDELTKMNKKSRKNVLEYVDRQRAGGATAIYDALELAFEDRRIDTIYLLTDGDPMGGKSDVPAEIRAQVKRWNTLRKVRIHSIAVGKPSPLLKDLSRDSGGEYKEVH